MSEAGKPKFSAFDSLASQVKKEPAAPVSAQVVKPETPVPMIETVRPAPVKKEQAVIPEQPRRARIQATEELEEKRIKEMVERQVRETIIGRRVSYKGPRVTRSYKIEPDIDQWLDKMQRKTGIEKSTFVIQAVRAKLENEFMDLKPEEESPIA